jgi:hypothetical protein
MDGPNIHALSIHMQMRQGKHHANHVDVLKNKKKVRIGVVMEPYHQIASHAMAPVKKMLRDTRAPVEIIISDPRMSNVCNVKTKSATTINSFLLVMIKTFTVI